MQQKNKSSWATGGGLGKQEECGLSDSLLANKIKVWADDFRRSFPLQEIDYRPGNIIFITNRQHSMSRDSQATPAGKDGRWSKEEHQKFLLGLEIYGRNWKEISKLVGTRSGSQIRSHAQKYFDKVKSVGSSRESTSSQQDSAEEETTANLSYYFSEISKLTLQAPEFKFWDLLIGIGTKSDSADSKSSAPKTQRSFTPYSQSPTSFSPIILK